MSNIKDYKYDWIWNKVTASGFQIAKHNPMKQHEIISVFNSGTYFPIMEKMENPDSYKCYSKSDSSPIKNNDGIKRTRTHKYPKSIISVSNANKSGQHPTQKPVALLEYLIKTYTIEGETVLDNTMGSGSTGVACKNLNRNFIGIELDPEYFKIAEKRINENL
jgi:site-specific DNA-methyltransferase (adenine-specific)